MTDLFVMFLFAIAIFLLLIMIAFAVGLLVHTGISALGRLSFGPYVPTHTDIAERMVAMAGITAGTRVLEPGSGDGRLCHLAAAKGATATGIERDPFLIFRSRWLARRRGLSDRVTFLRGNIWTTPFPSDTDVVLLYGLPNSMERLWDKMKKELRPGTFVISNTYAVPGIAPEREEGKVRGYRLSGS